MSAFTRRSAARRHNSQDAAISETSLRHATTTYNDEYADGYRDDQRSQRRDRLERDRRFKRDPYAQ